MIRKIIAETNWAREIKEALLIGLVGGLIQSVLTYNEFLRGDVKTDIFVFTWSAVVWISLWKGNQALVVIIDQYLTWLEQPGKRFVVGVICMVIYTITISMIIYTIFFGLIWGQDVMAQVRSDFPAFIYTPVGITSTIMVISHSSSFLKAWRQSAINFEKLKKEKLMVEYEALKNQVNPHFLFNSMNVLTSLVYEDQDKAVKFIRELSKVYRYVLDSRHKDLVSLEEEMAFVESYIFLQKIRFENNLVIDIDIDEEKMQNFVPPMALQLLLENAIKHNVVSEKRPLTIRIKSEDKALIIQNDLQEKLSKDSTGIGLENLKQRYQIISNEPITIKKDEAYFTVIIPLLTRNIPISINETTEKEAVSV